MRRDQHDAEWRPRPGQRYYFLCWDYCSGCRHVQHYPQFKTSTAALPPSAQGELFGELFRLTGNVPQPTGHSKIGLAPRARITARVVPQGRKLHGFQKVARFRKPRGANWTPSPSDPGIQSNSIRAKAMRIVSGGAARFLVSGSNKSEVA
jgi:hypothetical protein